ncbi:Histone deacetylase clr3 [Penicillium angulare]|uniref:Histone deacetylase clr3 n=1 Tax=Penicillium angulare TaxID=116970 RepID=UPI0025400B03|nr:Histone deacetylase clr3 [Penicillium angulare]KAJ5272293.1 Histone deacetylase clr3 [Penicillium angulare]
MGSTMARMAPPDRTIKMSDSESNSADASLTRKDSLQEPNSDWSDDEASRKPGLPLESLGTGLCYDVRMRYHCEVRPTSEVHPEDPRRIYYIFKELCQAGLVDDPESTRPLAPKTLVRIPARPATEEEIIKVHTGAHYAFVQSTKEMSDDALVTLEHNRDSIYFNRLTFDSALLSAGGAIDTCLAVAQRKVKNAIAVIRPPGHHAENNTAMGFCLFNNVSVAARVCQQTLGDEARKILILDWDVHHGNGIQKAFYNDPNILYISIHVHQDGRFYPGGEEGDWHHCGEGAGIGKNVNIPWPDQGMGDGDYMYAFQQVVMPIASEFNPDLVLIAAGFDAAAGDVLGGCFVTPACYAQMTHMLMTLANGKVAVCLEGGYNFRSISRSALSVTKTLMGEPPDRLLITTPSDIAINTVRRVMGIQGEHWRCMYPKPPKHPVWSDRLHGMPISPNFYDSITLTNMEDVLREVQSKQLYESFKFTPLPNYNKHVPLVIVFHDAPEIVGQPHPVTNKLDAHNCWLADPQKEYIAWFMEKGFAVIDINVPKHITPNEPSKRFEDDPAPAHVTEELIAYLWDNYISEIFFLGIGSAFQGVANFICQRGDTLHERIKGCISFVADNPVRAIASHGYPWLARWYHNNSLVFVSHVHGVWDRKRSLRYGFMRKSEKTELSEMLSEHMDEVFEWISDRIAVPSDEEEEEDEDSSQMKE